MKLLHTSDWHVGRTLRGLSRADEHRAVLAEVTAIAASHAVDLVLVTGDLFDTAAPTPEAEQIVYRALLDLEATGAEVIVIAGNHDSARRLEAVAPLLARAAVHVRSEWAPADEGGIVDVTCADGSAVQVACVPFLSQKAVVSSELLMKTDAAEQGGSYSAAMRSAVNQLAGQFRKNTVKVAAAHLFAHGAVAGGSERTAHIADGYAVPFNVFPSSLHYVALGHLHRPQDVGAPTIRYAGSPLQLDFGEAGEEKSVVLVEATPSAPAKITVVPLRAGRRLRTIEGTIDELHAMAGTTGDDHLKIVVHDHSRVGLAEDMRDLFPLCIDVLVARPDRAGTNKQRSTRAGRSPTDLFAAYLEENLARDERVQALFAKLLEEFSNAEPVDAA